MESAIISQMQANKEYILINMTNMRGKKALILLMSDNGYKYIKSSVKTTVKLFKRVVSI